MLLILELFLNGNNNYLNLKKNKLFSINTFYLNDVKNFNNICKYFKIFDIKYFFSLKFNIIKIEYKIGFYNYKNNLISPSDLTLYSNLHIFCYLEIIESNNRINSIPNIYQNSLYKCTEFYNINEKIKIGIQINQTIYNEIDADKIQINFMEETTFNFNNYIYIKDKIFDFLILNNEYKALIEKIHDNNINDSLKLQKSYVKYPLCSLKRFSFQNKNWNYLNLYNEYFCFCEGLSCKNLYNYKKCKYYFYLHIIDNNRKVYQKTDFLFIDFIFAELSSDDAFPVFKKMNYQNLSVHYITENIDIYNEFCYQKVNCESIILVNKRNFTIDGDFLQKYLTLILKLKQVITCGGIYYNYVNNIFYNIDYITLISITHGVCYFKYFLYEYKACYGKGRIDKIVIPPSRIIMSIAKNYGWEEKDIIKLNLPKWDKYNQNNNMSFDSKNEEKFKNNSILLLFTWRELINNKKISCEYFKNIKIFLHNGILIETLKRKNITLYFSVHHKLNEYNRYQKKFPKNEVIKFVEIIKIAECLSKTSLLVTDFSSVIFDLIYKRKPFIIFIPDVNDTHIKDIYTRNYYELIQSMKNGTIKFENKYLDINEAINKVIYYIDNNFKLDTQLKLFYDNLGIKSDNNLDRFVQEITNLN